MLRSSPLSRDKKSGERWRDYSKRLGITQEEQDRADRLCARLREHFGLADEPTEEALDTLLPARTRVSDVRLSRRKPVRSADIG